MNNQWKQRLVAVDGHQIATLYRPSDSPAEAPKRLLVFLHGITASVQLWPDVVQGLPEFRHHDCLSVSLPGHWPSTVPTGFSITDVTPQLFVRTISAAINHVVGDRPVDLIGWSTGGFAALALAGDSCFGPRVSSVVSLSGFARGAWHGWLGVWQHLAAWRVHRLSYHVVLRSLQRSGSLHVAIASSFLGQRGNRQLRAALASSSMHHELRQHDPATLQKLMGGIRFLDLTPTLTSIRCPVTIVNGDRDPVILPSEAEHLHRSIRGSTLVMLNNVGHMVLTEAPAVVLDQVLQCVSRV